MREVVVISGKGGTGKTSLAGAFAHLADNKILCDLDVDAPDLHILLGPEQEKKEDFYSGNEAVIIPELCTGCGICADMCRFGAVKEENGIYSIDPLRCEGCKVCVAFCPAEAVEFPERHCGEWYVSRTRFGPMVHAQLFPGEENSGRLVTLLKQQAKEIAGENGYNLVLCDGAPGIGCPVISSLAGTHLAVIVTEPTPSGRHDLERVGELCKHFKIPVGVIINKHDLNEGESKQIQTICFDRGYAMIARLPHDPVVTTAMVQGKVVTEDGDSKFARQVRQAWKGIVRLADMENREKE